MFIDSSAEFVRSGNKNKLSAANRLKILKTFTARKNAKYFAKIINNKAIAENDYNLAVSSYVVREDTRKVVNITQLNQEITQIVAHQKKLRTAIDKIVHDLEGANKK